MAHNDGKTGKHGHSWLQRRMMGIFLRVAVAAGAGSTMSQAHSQEDPQTDVTPTPPEPPQQDAPEIITAVKIETVVRELTAEEKEARLRDVISRGFQETTEEMASRGVKYELGKKDGVEFIDCSGFVEKAAMNAIGYLKDADSLYNPRKGQTSVFDTSAGYQIGETERLTRFAIKGVKNVLKADLKEGMLIGLNGGERGDWDHGLDHIVLIYRDAKTSELMVGQSSSRGNGVNAITLDLWKRRMKNYAGLEDLQAVDVVKLAQSVGATPDEAKLAAPILAAKAPSTLKL